MSRDTEHEEQLTRLSESRWSIACSCGWAPETDYGYPENAHSAWDDHCDQVFYESTMCEEGDAIGGDFLLYGGSA